MVKRALLAAVAALMLSLTGDAQRPASSTLAAPPEVVPYEGVSKGLYPGELWQEAASPEQLGWSEEWLATARAYSEHIGSAAVMIVDDGIVVDAWGDITQKHHCYSIRKSLLSALIGIHVDEGHIDLSKTMEGLGIDDKEPSLTATERQATVADLIKARSGVYHSALGEAITMNALRPDRHSHAPGTFWYYNNWDFNTLGTIFEQETGTRIFEEFSRRIAEPLQMEDFQVDDCRYLTVDYYANGEPSIHPYYLFRMSARDLARFGLLFLREGRWRDEQIISVDWVRESTATHSRTGPDSGYGYMWWTGAKGGLFPNVEVEEHGYYASGYGGQRVIVLPYRNLVIVHLSNADEERYVTSNQIGTLLWMILAAAGETEMGRPPFVGSAKGARLTGVDLKEALAGSTLRGASARGSLAMFHSDDGTMSVSLAGVLIDTGNWWIAGDEYCHQFTAPELGRKACYSVVVDGTAFELFDHGGALFGEYSLQRKATQTGFD
jgi:CubicO group peptidase (beta-lactamase class C family)